MATKIRTSGDVRNPHNGGKLTHWTLTQPIIDTKFEVFKHSGTFTFLGDIGNAAHLAKFGAHTPWCNYTFRGKRALHGRIYAIDVGFRKKSVATQFEKWAVGKLRAGAYPEVKFININGRQWNRDNGFRAAFNSDDIHLHYNVKPGAEAAHSRMLPDFHQQVVLGKPSGSGPAKRVDIGYVKYVVRDGDTLSAIAAKFRTSVSAIAALNKISDPNLIRAKQELKIPKGAPPSTATKVFYKVVSGDTMGAIAKRYDTTVAKIQALNGGRPKNANVIHPGETYRVK
jgi:LysM repeat protein